MLPMPTERFADEDEAGKDGEAGNVEHLRYSRTPPAEAAVRRDEQINLELL
jgi:hypothetical protein